MLVVTILCPPIGWVISENTQIIHWFLVCVLQCITNTETLKSKHFLSSRTALLHTFLHAGQINHVLCTRTPQTDTSTRR